MRSIPMPPVRDGVHCQVGGVAGSRHTHMALVAQRIVDAIWGRAALGIGRKIVSIYRFASLGPRLASIFELAQEFLLLCVDTDSRLATVAELSALCSNVLELLITLNM